eukprot:6185493-Pleurochrysis_carterae.AAC.5
MHEQRARTSASAPRASACACVHGRVDLVRARVRACMAVRPRACACFHARIRVNVQAICARVRSKM